MWFSITRRLHPDTVAQIGALITAALAPITKGIAHMSKALDDAKAAIAGLKNSVDAASTNITNSTSATVAELQKLATALDGAAGGNDDVDLADLATQARAIASNVDTLGQQTTAHLDGASQAADGHIKTLSATPTAGGATSGG